MKLLIFLQIALLSAPCVAGSVSYTVIENIMTGPGYNGKVFVKGSNAVANKPTCSTAASWDFAFDSTLPGGKETLSLLMTAYSTGKGVYLHGLDVCTVWSDIEDLRFVMLKP